MEQQPANRLVVFTLPHRLGFGVDADHGDAPEGGRGACPCFKTPHAACLVGSSRCSNDDPHAQESTSKVIAAPYCQSAEDLYLLWFPRFDAVTVPQQPRTKRRPIAQPRGGSVGCRMQRLEKTGIRIAPGSIRSGPLDEEPHRSRRCPSRPPESAVACRDDNAQERPPSSCRPSMRLPLLPAWMRPAA
jgi:hypothetical protein